MTKAGRNAPKTSRRRHKEAKKKQLEPPRPSPSGGALGGGGLEREGGGGATAHPGTKNPRTQNASVIMYIEYTTCFSVILK